MSFSRSRSGLLVLSLLLLFIAASSHAADPSKKLSPEFRHWLNEEVNYIITSDERKEFLSLGTDGERDSFIKSFWAARNPDPNSDINTYEEEHYRRLAYVNAHFGNVKAQNGWHTDQGMIYILLGEPKQIANYPAARNMRPIQIWFYESTTPALPSHFNILFYKRSMGEPYTLYSPYQDGPVRLVTGLENLNDQVRSIKMIQNSLGDEVARTTLSLIPTEPVDLNNYAPSMQSDALLAAIRGLADSPIEKQRLALNRSREEVTASIFTSSAAMDVVTMTSHDAAGRSTVSYLARFDTPMPDLIRQQPGKTPAYNMTLRTIVATTSGKPVYEEQDSLQGSIMQSEVDALRKQRFAAEGRLPLVPGSYDVEVTLTNNLNLQAHRWRNHIEVPAGRSDKLGISGLLVFKGSAVHDPGGELPFDLAAIRFSPVAAQSVAIHPGDKLPLVFQLWLPKMIVPSGQSKTVHLHYMIGNVAAGGKPALAYDEDIDASNSDEAGNLVTGHTLETEDLGVGSYRLVVQATMSGEPAPAYSTLNLRVLPPQTPVDQWTAHAAEQSTANAADDLKRGLAAEALGREAEAEGLYRSALKADPSQVRALVRLVTVLSAQQKTGELAKLADSTPPGAALPPETLMQIAGALRDTGDLKIAVKLLNTQFALQPPSAPMYELLARIYESEGDRGQAASIREQAKKVATAKSIGAK